jgi:hypothetical protein
MLREKFEYKYLQAQAFWNPDINDTEISPDLNELAREGWRIIKIVPREKDFFDIFFERKISDMQLINVTAIVRYSINKGATLFKPIEYQVPNVEQSLIMLFATEGWRELHTGNLEVYGITFSFRQPTEYASLTDS